MLGKDVYHVRTTIDPPDELRARLMALAARCESRGYSEIVREAVERYLQDEEMREERLKDFLALKGSVGEEEGERFRERLDEVWSKGR